jgi:hypothetical protein
VKRSSDSNGKRNTRIVQNSLLILALFTAVLAYDHLVTARGTVLTATPSSGSEKGDIW